MSEWVEKRLGEMIYINPSLLPSNYNGLIKYVDISSVERGRLLGYTEYDFSEAPGRAKRIIKNDDTIISTVRPNLRAYWYVKNCLDNTIVSTGFAVIRAKGKNNGRFIYYLLTENSFVDYLTLVAKGSNYPAVDTNDFKKAKVTVPSFSTQTRIAEILSAYDDAIENNNRRIMLLEKAAQELYREWFVRFRFPGYKKAKFANGLPEGWEVKKLEKISDFKYGTMPKQESLIEKGYPIFSGYRITGYYNEYMFEKEQLILIARGVGGTGEVRISPPFCYLTNLSIAFLLKDDKYKFYLYEMFQLQNLRYLDTGAAQSQITIENLRQCKVVIPSISLISKFGLIASELYNLKMKLNSQSKNLARQRDLLLPRLMSGKLEL